MRNGGLRKVALGFRGLGWARISLGSATMLVLAVLLTLLLFATVDRLLYATVMGVGKLMTSATGDLLGLVDALSVLFHLAAALVALCGFALLVVAVVFWLQQPASGPAEAYTRYENAELAILWLVVGPIVLSPVVVLAGYLGGRFGQPLIRRIADR